MANYLAANPEEAGMIAHWCGTANGLVPVAKDGQFIVLVNPARIADFTPDASITAEDYVVGMELLGFTFEVVADPKHGQLLGEYDPAEPCPESWHKHALTLMQARSKGRVEEVIAFLIQRDGVSGDDR